MNDKNLYAPPKAKLEQFAEPVVAPVLWNPNAAASWGLLFSPVFSAILQMKNWDALGEPQKAASARLWAVGCLVLILAESIALMLLPPSRELNSLGRITGIALLLAWYFVNGREQIQYVRTKFGDSYPRRGLAKPLGLAVLALFGFIVLLSVIAVIAVSK